MKEKVDGVEKLVVRWKIKDECKNVKYVEEYYVNKEKIEKPKVKCIGSLEAQFKKAMDETNMSKDVKLDNIFNLLRRGHPMIDY